MPIFPRILQREEQERLEQEVAAREIEEQRQKAIEAQVRREEEKREEARHLKETLEQQMTELKERETEVLTWLLSFLHL